MENEYLYIGKGTVGGKVRRIPMSLLNLHKMVQFIQLFYEDMYVYAWMYYYCTG
jgi:hypothetical protein